MSAIGCDEVLRTRYFETLGVTLVWLMNETTLMPQTMYFRHTIDMKPAVWNALVRLYSRQARRVVENEFEFFSKEFINLIR